MNWISKFPTSRRNPSLYCSRLGKGLVSPRKSRLDHSQQYYLRPQVAFSSKSDGGNSKNMKRPRVQFASSSGGPVEKGIWYTTTSPRSTSLDMGRYGLKRLNYETLDPPVWTVPPHPPTKTVQERILFPLTLVLVAGFGLWAYMNPEEEDMKQYWTRVETGQILVEDDDDTWDDGDGEDEE